MKKLNIGTEMISLHDELERLKCRSESFSGIVDDYLQAVQVAMEAQIQVIQLRKEADELRCENDDLLAVARQKKHEIEESNDVGEFDLHVYFRVLLKNDSREISFFFLLLIQSVLFFGHLRVCDSFKSVELNWCFVSLSKSEDFESHL